MIEFYILKSPLVKSLKPIEVLPNSVDLFPTIASNFPAKNTHAISFQSLLDFNHPSKKIRTQDGHNLLSINPSAYMNCSPKSTNSISPEPSLHMNLLSKCTASVANGASNHPPIQRSERFHQKFKKIPPRPTKGQVNVTKLSPITSQILSRIYKLGPSPNIVVIYTNFIKFLGDSGHSTEASELFGLMKEKHDPDVISFTVLIRILCDSKQLDQALNLIQEMASYNCEPDIICYNILIDKLGEAGQEEVVSKLWSEMQSNGIHPDVVTYSSLVKSLCTVNKIVDAIFVLEHMETNEEIELNTYVYNTIIKSFLDLGRIEEALGILGRMVIHGCSPDLCSFNLFIKYFSDLGEGLKASMFLNEMNRRGIQASEGSYRMCVLGLVKEGKVREVIELIEKIRNSSVLFSVCTWNKLIMWLGKMGRPDDAYEIFLGMKEPDEITMNSVIHMLYNHGRSDEAWDVFNLMKDMKIEPSIVTYNILVHGLGKEGRCREALELVSQIEAEKFLLPDVITYNCLLDGLCKAGDVDDACKLVLKMVKRGCKPDVISFNTLINGLISVDRVEDACRLFEHMRGKLTSHTVPMETLLMEMIGEK